MVKSWYSWRYASKYHGIESLYYDTATDVLGVLLKNSSEPIYYRDADLYSVCVCLGCRNHIVAAGHTCVLCDTREFSSASDVSSLMMQEPRFEAALAIHLFKGGRLLLGDTSPGLSKMHAYVGFTILVRASHRCN